MNTTSTQSYTVIKKSEVSSASLSTQSALNISKGKGKTDICILAPVVSDSVLSLIQNDTAGRAWMVAQVDGLRSKIASGQYKKLITEKLVSAGISEKDIVTARKAPTTAANKTLLERVKTISDTLIPYSVPSDTIGITAMLTAMEESVVSARLSMESIASWFPEVMQEPMTDRIKSKMVGISEDKCDAILAGVLEHFQKLAGKTAIVEKDRTKMLEFISMLPEVADEDAHPITIKILEKLTGTEKEKATDNLLDNL